MVASLPLEVEPFATVVGSSPPESEIASALRGPQLTASKSSEYSTNRMCLLAKFAKPSAAGTAVDAVRVVGACRPAYLLVAPRSGRAVAVLRALELARHDANPLAEGILAALVIALTVSCALPLRRSPDRLADEPAAILGVVTERGELGLVTARDHEEQDQPESSHT